MTPFPRVNRQCYEIAIHHGVMSPKRGGRVTGVTCTRLAVSLAMDGSSDEWRALRYLGGFHNHVETEALPGTLPVGQNSPQHLPHGLYAEQLSGTAFTAPRAANRRSWLYRLAPSVQQGAYTPHEAPSRLTAHFPVADPTPRRWGPLPRLASPKVDFVDGMRTLCGTGAPAQKEGVAIHLYACNAPMADRALCDADGELLLVPQHGALRVATELGRLLVAPGEIVVLPRGLRFSVSPDDADGEGAECRGYALELFAGRGFVLPELGAIGANGLAEPRDFLTPTAWFEDRHCPQGFRVTTKYAGRLFDTTRTHSPFDVVAWHGNYAPYKYDLSRFHAVNTVTVDHPDPSIFTVLTCPSSEPGVAVADFVIFPPRWMCAEHTFRPPYFHRNVMSEFMGLIRGAYDAKAAGDGGFLPGGASLHVACTPHGPDAGAYAGAIASDTSVPHRFDGGLAFMFETSGMLQLTEYAVDPELCNVQQDYAACWQGLPRASLPAQLQPSECSPGAAL
ncbi:hypothetical protein AB1Y20_001751 [Prymnesium parvum]|uniref:homogentisate 1,2-dioxygenase n=1 Tax=Prymnesium parvum TaxID=97485 RepID=A0AB34KBR4_PRYPA